MSARRCAPLLLTAGLLGSLVSGATAAPHPWFAPSAVTAAGSHVVDFAVGDFNGDATPDLAVASLGYHLKSVRVILGRGGGAFTPGGPPVTLAEAPVRLFAADFNADGKLDVAVSQNDDPSEASVHVSILLGDGAGVLRPAPGSPVEFGEPGAVADVSGDHKPDLVGFDDDDRVVISLGDGTGRFLAARSPIAGSRVAVADFNADGLPDLVVGHDKDISILLGTGSGRFAAARKIARAFGSLIAADFNGDQKPDLAVAGKPLTILLGNGAGSFSRAPGSPVKGDYRSLIAAADVTGDGRTDLVTGVESLVLLLGDGTGRFHRVVGSMRLPFSAGVVAAGDLNGDGKADVAVHAVVYSDYGEPEEGQSGVVALIQGGAPVPRPSVSEGHRLSHVQNPQFSVRGAIFKFAADGNSAAAMATGGGGGHCSLGDRVVVWNASRHKATIFDRLADPRCPYVDTYVEEFALGKDSVAWITESEAGNTQGWHDVFAARLAGGGVRRIQSVSGRAIYDALGSWTGHLLGGGSVLAYNAWSTSCEPPPESECSPGDIRLQVDGTSLVRITAGRRVVVKHGAGSYRLSAVGGGRMAVESTDGTITVVAPSGAHVASVLANGDMPLSAALSSTRLAIVRWSRTLDVYNPASGRKSRSFPLGEGTPTALAGVNAKLALLRRSGRLVLVRLGDGRLISLHLPPRLVGAVLTERGLFYAYNVPRAHGGRIVFEKNAALLRRF